MSEGNGLPRGWAEPTLLECSSRITDGTHLPPQFVDEGVPFIFVKHIAQGRLTFDDTKFITPSTWHEFQSRCPVEEGDILYSAVGSYGVAVSVDTAQPFSFQRNIAHIKPDRRLCTKYLTFSLNSPLGLRQAHAVARGVAQKTVTLGDLKQFIVPIAPLPEQHRIVEKIEELFSDLDAGVASLQRAKANLKRYRASVLKSAVEGRLTEEWRKEHPQAEEGQMLLDRILRERREKWEQDQLLKFKEKGKEPPKNWESKYEEPSAPETSELPELPEGWVWAKVEQVAHTATGGTPDRKNSDYFGGGIPWVKSGELGDGYVHETEETLTALGVEESNAKVFPKGTLCIALYGATVGKLGILEMDATTNQAVCGIFLPAEVRREYLFHYLTLIRPKLVEQGKGGAQSNISNGLVRITVFPLPPLAEQEQIVALVEERLSQIDSAEKTIDAELIRSKRLRQSILKRAFGGKLVPQDPKDEPASVLLDRIKASREAEQPKKKAKKVKAK